MLYNASSVEILPYLAEFQEKFEEISTHYERTGVRSVYGQALGT